MYPSANPLNGKPAVTSDDANLAIQLSLARCNCWSVPRQHALAGKLQLASNPPPVLSEVHPTDDKYVKFLLTQQGPDHTTRSLISSLVRVADRSENDGVNFHHWPVHRHLGKGGLLPGASEHIILPPGGRRLNCIDCGL